MFSLVCVVCCIMNRLLLSRCGLIDSVCVWFCVLCSSRCLW